MRKLILFSILICGLVLAGLWIQNWWQEGRFWESTENAYTHSDITVISAKVPGIVALVKVKENEAVKAGDVLISMYKPTFNARVARAQAEVKRSDASIGRLRTQQKLQNATIAANQAEVRSAVAELQRAKLDLIRAETLKDKGFAEKQRYDHAVTDVAAGEAEVARTRANLAAARSQLTVLDAETKEVAAERERAAAELKLAQIALDLSEIRAPRDGIIGAKQVEEGEYIHVGARKMAVVSLDEVWVSANFKETQLTTMRPGQRARVKVDAFPGEEISGVVDSLSPASGAQFSLLPPDNATGNFTKIVQRVPVKILLDKAHPVVPQLRPGMSVVAKVDVRAQQAQPETNNLPNHQARANMPNADVTLDH